MPESRSTPIANLTARPAPRAAVVTALAALAALGATMLATPPARAAVTVLGSGLGESCFRMVDGGSDSSTTLDTCSRALAEGRLGRVDRAATLTNRGIVQIRRGALEAGLRDFDAAIALAPELGDPHVNRGAALLRLERPEEALAALDLGVARMPTRPAAAHFNRAIARETTGDVRGAYADLRRAAELEPEWALPRTELVRFTILRP